MDFDVRKTQNSALLKCSWPDGKLFSHLKMLRKFFDIEKKNADTIHRKIKIQTYIYRVILVLLKCIEKNMKIMPNDDEIKGVLFI